MTPTGGSRGGAFEHFPPPWPLSTSADAPCFSASVALASQLEECNRVQESIVALAQRCGFEERELFAIRLAVEEAMMNALKHGNGFDASKRVQVDYAGSRQEVRVRIVDEGPGFDPDRVPDPTSPEFLERPSGRGLLLMRYYMSGILFHGRGNCVEMWKRRGECAGAPCDS
ncbi:MAG: ATP-binding protein [Planctomycetes bacterium]|nr:ATP-binding protein [Planctomycetota bacterium]